MITSQRSLRLIFACCTLALLTTGCSLSGRWVGSDLRPELARDDFDLFRPVTATANFARADIRLQEDGTFSADVVYGDEVTRASGTWRYEGNRLTLTDSKGNASVYNVEFKTANTIHLIALVEGTDVTLKLNREN